MLISHSTTLAIFFFFQFLPSLRHVSHLFPILLIIIIFFLAFLLPHLTVTLLPIISLPFWLFFSSLFHTLLLQFLHLSSPFLTLLLPILFSISLYHNFSSNLSPPFLALLLPIISHLTKTIPSTLTLHFLNLLLLIFSSINLLLLPLHLSFPFSQCFAYKEM